jgi:hypothetical protein
MFSGNQDQFAVAAINARLEALLDGVCAGNGTPLAAVVAVALEVDRRKAAAIDHARLTYSDDELIDLAVAVLATLQNPHFQTTLPFGTVFESRDRADILIGGERWTLDAGRPGLYPVYTTRKDAHGPNLELLHHHSKRPVETVVGNGRFRDAGGGTGMTGFGWFSAIPVPVAWLGSLLLIISSSNHAIAAAIMR